MRLRNRRDSRLRTKPSRSRRRSHSGSGSRGLKKESITGSSAPMLCGEETTLKLTSNPSPAGASTMLSRVASARARSKLDGCGCGTQSLRR